MALYQDTLYVREAPNAAFDQPYDPGAPAPVTGVYRCVGCDIEIVRNKGLPLPWRRCHDTPAASCAWRLVVGAEQP